MQGVWAGGTGGTVPMLGEPQTADHHSVSDHHPHLPGNHKWLARVQRWEPQAGEKIIILKGHYTKFIYQFDVGETTQPLVIYRLGLSFFSEALNSKCVPHVSKKQINDNQSLTLSRDLLAEKNQLYFPLVSNGFNILMRVLRWKVHLVQNLTYLNFMSETLGQLVQITSTTTLLLLFILLLFPFFLLPARSFI